MSSVQTFSSSLPSEEILDDAVSKLFFPSGAGTEPL